MASKLLNLSQLNSILSAVKSYVQKVHTEIKNNYIELLFGYNTAVSVVNVPVNKRLVFITISGNASFNLVSIPDAGREIHCVVKNTSSSDVTITIPNAGNYVSAIGTTLKIKAGSIGEISVISDGTNGYIRGV